MPENQRKHRSASRWTVFIFVVMLAVPGSIAALFHPKTPLPEEWNPVKPLIIAAPITPLTQWKLRNALSDDAVCFQVLRDGGAKLDLLPPLAESDQCHIRPRVTLSGVGDARLKPVETRCQTALRLAMWEQHGLQVAALRHLGQSVTEIRHYSSYNCRRIRTPGGDDGRMSEHATADAIDVSGFVMQDDSSVDLQQDWPSNTPKSAFLRDAFQSACMWFPIALGPDFNSLHADHFHLQTRGWGYCR